MSDKDEDKQEETPDFGKVEEGRMPASAVPYEFTLGANARVPHEKPALMNPADSWQDRVNLITVLLMGGLHLFEVECARCDRILKLWKIEDDILHVMVGMWNATSLPENAFDDKDKKPDEGRTKRPQHKRVLRFWLPIFKLEKEQQNSVNQLWEVLGERAIPTRELVEWFHDMIEEAEKPAVSRIDSEIMTAPFTAGSKVWLENHHGYIAHDNNTNWRVNDVLQPRPRPEPEPVKTEDGEESA